MISAANGFDQFAWWLVWAWPYCYALPCGQNQSLQTLAMCLKHVWKWNACRDDAWWSHIAKQAWLDHVLLFSLCFVLAWQVSVFAIALWMRDDTSLVGLWIVGGQRVVEECQHACSERKWSEQCSGEWIGETEVHGKSEAKSNRRQRGIAAPC
jgi:hypothetical protein